MSGRKHHKTKYPGVFYRESGQDDKTYEVCYRDAAGKLCWHTVGRASSGIRPAYANQVRGELLKDVAAGKNPAAARTITVGEAVDAYLTWADAEGKHTGPDRNRYERHLRSRLHAMPLVAITPQILIDTKQLLAQTLGDQSLRHAFGFLRRAVNYTIEVRNLGIVNPFSVKRNGAFRLPRVENAAVRFLTREEARLLLADLRRRSHQLHDMALLSLKTGMRLTEIFGVTGQDIDRAARVVHFTAMRTISPSPPETPSTTPSVLSMMPSARPSLPTRDSARSRMRSASRSTEKALRRDGWKLASVPSRLAAVRRTVCTTPLMAAMPARARARRNPRSGDTQPMARSSQFTSTSA